MVTEANYDVPVSFDFHLGLEYPFVESTIVVYITAIPMVKLLHFALVLLH